MDVWDVPEESAPETLQNFWKNSQDKTMTNFEFPRVTYVKFTIFFLLRRRQSGSSVNFRRFAFDFCPLSKKKKKKKMDRRVHIEFSAKNKSSATLAVARGEATSDRNNDYEWY